MYQLWLHFIIFSPAHSIPCWQLWAILAFRSIWGWLKRNYLNAPQTCQYNTQCSAEDFMIYLKCKIWNTYDRTFSITLVLRFKIFSPWNPQYIPTYLVSTLVSVTVQYLYYPHCIAGAIGMRRVSVWVLVGCDNLNKSSQIKKSL